MNLESEILLQRALAFESECKEMYDNDGEEKRRHDVLGMSDALAEQAIILLEGK
jgi:hypothetical protein